ncbi:hypothetical protein Deipr_2452 (plasmid) [Deinococcus proteolyticus MRP]|uniref:Type IV pilus assembly protein PilO n=1 Tax=Deinococcus proteolyticus (strain ATCC 35074 / DSM 20540 / JCM 6276 / NBRC 101906 / NCIMB 13154 / VKM Ac-1939 / CCM 2703 / MRP) TaxID=693977 RepID=F0RQL0_DEIPM|nr:type 4a pilus biogenesis protein PilO [Deinococcus proteolyticus]ADY27569.1 hypothetical protein Deipr_2452 [Deinococcus proteolyticus MRP]
MKPLYLILGLILAIALNLVLTRPALNAQPALKAEQQNVRTEHDSAETKLAEIPQLQTELSQRQQALSELEKSFPAHEEIGILIQTLQQAADQNRIAISEITRTTQPSPIPGFNEVQLGLTTTGSFPDLYTFLDWAHDQKRLLNVTNINSNSGTNHQINVTGYTRAEVLPVASTPASPDPDTSAASGAATSPTEEANP